MSRMKAGFWIWMFLLLGLALYQIILIFWESPTEREGAIWNSMVQPDTDANMLRPDEIFFTLGGNDGSYGRVGKQDEEFEDIFLNSYELLSYVLKNGKVETENWDQLPWEKEACVLSYGFELKSDLIMEQVGMESELVSGSWSEIWILPAQNRQENACIYILEQESGQCLKVEYAAWKMEQNQQLLVLLRQKESVLSKDYLAVGKWWPGREIQGSYVLENTLHETAYPVNANVVFTIGRQINASRGKEYAMRFFQYPDTVTIKESESQILYNNEKITVKVDENGFLQYVETLTQEEEEPVTMQEAYQLAVGFVKADLELDPIYNIDFSFAGYEVGEDQYIFDFNYLICGIPFQMESEKMAYPIRVTVEGSRVRKYERFVLEFTVERDHMYTLGYTWKEAMDQMAEKGDIPQGVPKLKYYLEGSQLVLYWEAETKAGRCRIRADQ